MCRKRIYSTSAVSKSTKAMSVPHTPSEEFTHGICTNSFLSIWSFNNPQGRGSKELCDVLVVCDPNIVVFSVKEIALVDDGSEVECDRWQRKAVDASIKQLYGASRWLQSASHVIHSDGSQGISLPPSERRRIHLVAVAFGSNGRCVISSGNRGKGYVHVLTEETLCDILSELDTISDFVHYLDAKEDFASTGGGIVIEGSESDLLGLYLHGGRTFPQDSDFLMIGPGVWEEVQSKPEFQARKREDEDSYKWDYLVEMLGGDFGHDNSPFGLEPTQREFVVRAMARENRFFRRLLAKSLSGFLADAKANKTRSRYVQSNSGVVYVFAYFRLGEERNARVAELTARCFVALNSVDGVKGIAIGIGFSEFNPSIGSETDLVHMEVDPARDEWRHEAEMLKNEFGYFKSPVSTHLCQDEFPPPQPE